MDKFSTTFSWSGPVTYSSADPFLSLGPLTLNDAGTYILTVSGTGCQGSATVSDSVTLYVAPAPVVTITGNDTLCEGGTLQLTGTVSGGTYYWLYPDYSTSTQLNVNI